MFLENAFKMDSDQTKRYTRCHVVVNILKVSGGVVVQLLACGVRGPGFDFRSRRYDFRDWLSPASKSRYG